jgi:PBP1b-binding outer membrane lipoprotein LpoB
MGRTPEENAMKALVTLSAAALLAAGCATTENVQVAQKNCKVQPVQTATYANPSKAKKVDSLRQREAEFDLARTDYRFQQLARNGVFNNTVEEALRDCY